MIVWPHLPVWPFFLVGCVVLFKWNVPAALSFATYWLLFQIYKTISPDQIVYFHFISYLAAWVFLYYERVAGTFLALVAIIYASHIFGNIPQFQKVIATEAIIGIGMLLSGFLGPTTGIFMASLPPWGGYSHSGGRGISSRFKNS